MGLRKKVSRQNIECISGTPEIIHGIGIEAEKHATNLVVLANIMFRPTGEIGPINVMSFNNHWEFPKEGERVLPEQPALYQPTPQALTLLGRLSSSIPEASNYLGRVAAQIQRVWPAGSAVSLQLSTTVLDDVERLWMMIPGTDDPVADMDRLQSIWMMLARHHTDMVRTVPLLLTVEYV